MKNAFIVDGGGSSTMVALADSGYELVNRPCDKDSNGNYGAARTVVNSVILSYGKDRNAPQDAPADPSATQAPSSDATQTPSADITQAPENNNGKNNNKPGKGWTIALIVGSVVAFALAVFLAIRAANKKFGKD